MRFSQIFVSLLLAVYLSTSCTSDISPTVTTTDGNSDYVPQGYELTWNDEFNYEGMPDTSHWSYQTGGYGWTAKELQYYTGADADNVGVQDGSLTITARKKRKGRNQYTSARLVSKHKGEVKYGYIEVRAKMAKGNGLRSAFWLVGSDVLEAGWPNTGEIDLVEHYGKFPTVVSAAVQTKDNFWSGPGQKGASTQVSDASENYHIYSCLWTKDELVFSVDGQPYFTYGQQPGRGRSGYPFDHPFYMVATLSVGGERGPNAVVDDAAFPAAYKIDYVRIYETPTR